MNLGVPPTPRNARTGEFTPPGINSSAVANNCSELLLLIGLDCMFMKIVVDHCRFPISNAAVQIRRMLSFGSTVIERKLDMRTSPGAAPLGFERYFRSV